MLEILEKEKLKKQSKDKDLEVFLDIEGLEIFNEVKDAIKRGIQFLLSLSLNNQPTTDLITPLAKTWSIIIYEDLLLKKELLKNNNIDISKTIKEVFFTIAKELDYFPKIPNFLKYLNETLSEKIRIFEEEKIRNKIKNKKNLSFEERQQILAKMKPKLKEMGFDFDKFLERRNGNE